MGPGVGGRGHERHARPAAGVRPGRRIGRRTRAGRSAASGSAAACGPPRRRPVVRTPGRSPTELTRRRRHRRPRSPGRAPSTARSPRGGHSRGGRSPRPSPGGFAGVYPVLKAMEEAGRARRGYFVAGLGAAQFALPGRRRPAPAALREPPGGPGDARPGRGRPRPALRRRAAVAGQRGPAVTSRPVPTSCRSAGAPAAFLERGAKTLVTFGGHERRRVGRCARVSGEGRPPPAHRAPADRRHARGRASGGRHSPLHRLHRRLPGAHPPRLTGGLRLSRPTYPGEMPEGDTIPRDRGVAAEGPRRRTPDRVRGAARDRSLRRVRASGPSVSRPVASTC